MSGTNRFWRSMGTRLVNYIPVLLVLLAAALGAIQIRLQVGSDPRLSDESLGEIVTTYEFDSPVQGEGWHTPEDSTMWTSATESTLNLALPPEDYQVVFQVSGILPEVLDNLSLRANGQQIELKRENVPDGWTRFRGIIPTNVVNIDPENTILTFNINRVVTPEALGIGDDSRSLGLRFDNLRVGLLDPPVVQPLSLFVIIALASALGVTLVMLFYYDPGADASPLIELDFASLSDDSDWDIGEDQAWTTSTSATLHLPHDSHRLRSHTEVWFRGRGAAEGIAESLSMTVNGQAIALKRYHDESSAQNWYIYRGVIPRQVLKARQGTVEMVFQVEKLVERAPVTPPMVLAGVDALPTDELPAEYQEDPHMVGMAFDWLRLERIRGPYVPSWAWFNRIVPAPNVQRFAFLSLLVALAAAVAGILAFIPELALTQLAAFTGLAFILGFLTMILTPTPNVSGKETTLGYHIGTLWENRILLAIWTRYNVLSRYSQAFLGILWIIIQPLAISVLLAFVFSQVLKVIDTGGAPYISFYMVAIVPWTLFNIGMNNGVGSLLGATVLITQVYFPREILVLVKLGETLVDVSFTFVAMLIINLVMGILPNANFIYLLPLIVIQVCLMMGLMLFVSFLSVMVRDIPQLIVIILQLLFYLTPILYPIEAIPAEFRFISLINPLAPLVDAYRAIILYNTPPDPVSLYYPIVLAGVALYCGYMFFKKNEKRMMDYI